MIDLVSLPSFIRFSDRDAAPLKARVYPVVQDTTFAKLLFVSIFFMTSQFAFRLGIQPFGLLAIYAICAFFVITRPEWLRSIWPVLGVPMIALALSLWSIDPALSAYRSIQLLMTTLMGVIVANLLPPYRAMILISLCELSITGLSLLNSVVVFLPPAFDRGEFIGVLAHKNHLSHAVIFSGAGLLALAFYFRMSFLGILGAICLFPVLDATESAGGKVLYFLLLVLVSLFWLRHQPWILRQRIFAAFCIAISCVLAVILTCYSELISTSIEALGKDSTLTGRTILWKFGFERFWDHPLTGYGFQAFWNEPSFTREYLRAFVDPRTSIFHNGYIEILVALGLVGGGIGIALFVACVWSTLRWYLLDATITSAFFAFCMLLMLIASFVEPLLFGVHSFNHILVVLAYCYSVYARNGYEKKP